MVEEAIEMKVHKMNYFRNRWNWLDIAVIGTSCAQIILNVSLNFSIGPKLDSLIAQPFEHADFSTLAAKYVHTQVYFYQMQVCHCYINY
jgi:polycystin 2